MSRKTKHLKKRKGPNNSLNLRAAFFGLQKEMFAALASDRKVIKHPGAKGNVTEKRWLEMLQSYLPKRYSADKAFVVDHKGRTSDEIDIVIYDRQFSPFLFKRDGAIFIPAESVYAAIEVKQDLSKKHLEYAGEKFASVKKLSRTSATIHHAGGSFKPKPHFEILTGILTTDSTWKNKFGSETEKINCLSTGNKKVDLGCVLRFGAFSINNAVTKSPIDVRQGDLALIYFFMSLLDRLQKLATVPAIDIPKYIEVLER
jgi:hypothetical protein